MSDESNPTPPGTAPAGSGESRWAREVLERLALGALAEQRRARRWGVFFKLAVLAYLVAVLALAVPWQWPSLASAGRHTALVEIRGIISDGAEASADRVVAGLRAAFEDEDTAGVILRINSPGGTPVQAGYIHDEIRRLREAHPSVPLHAVITDVAASGGYYVAAAADRIYASPSSLVGSIGVLLNGFGFVGTMDKLGVERRLYTAGEHKGFLDPFSPARPEEVAHLRSMLGEIHRQFIDAVRAGRGDRLTGPEEALFSGLVWTGRRGRELGLIDDFGSASYVAREVIGEERIVDFTPRRSLLEAVAERVGAAAARAMAGELGLRGVLPGG